MRRRLGNRGFVLVSSYLLLSVLLIYSNALTMGALNQQLAADQLRERLQATNLSQAAMEQLQEDLNYFLTTYIYQNFFRGQADEALRWLDALGTGTEVPQFDVPWQDVNHDGIVDLEDQTGSRTGVASNKRDLVLSPPAIRTGQQGTATTKASLVMPVVQHAPIEYARAWITQVRSAKPGDPLAPRLVTMEAEAKVGRMVKRLRATYRIELGTSDIFRYAYFVNNFGWFNAGSATRFDIMGEIRANGDMSLTGVPYYGDRSRIGNIRIDGDLYASQNPELINPSTDKAAKGTVSGGEPVSIYDNLANFWDWKGVMSRPARRLTFPDQPPIGGKTKFLPPGLGWDTDYPGPDPVSSRPRVRKFEKQPTQPIPYLGDLKLYKALAQAHNNQAGSTLTYTDPGRDGRYNTWDDKRVTLKGGVYYGPDGRAGTADDKQPLVLVATDRWWNRVEVDGPFVVPGDVIIKGPVKGRGTIYSGRNVHLAGSITYIDPPIWPAVERHQQTGQIRTNPWTYSNYPDLGSVCANGTYVPTSKGPVSTRCR